MAAVPVDFTVAKIVSLLENKASMLGGVRDELRKIRHELISMRSFLEDADRKRAHTEGEKAWVANVRDIAYDVEDIIDEFMYCINRPQREGKFARFLHQTIHFPKNIWVWHRIASKLRKVNNMINSISERHQRYGVDHIEGTSSHDDHKWVRSLGESSLFTNDDELVGIENDKELLLRWLTNGQPQRTVISVLGMGGSGKTTLVAKAYSSQVVKRHFDCYAWISVSQAYVIEDIFRSMIKEFHQAMKELIPVDLNTMSYKQLVEILVNCLHPKRYVLVLDDVWNINLWTQVKVSLPDGRHGSRVLLTTRKEDIASFSFGVGSYVHRIQPLGKKEAWDLFCMKAFSSNLNRCHPELEILAKGIVEKCEGLPLAIVALGGLMSSKDVESEWRKVYNSLSWELSNNPMLEVVKSILLLSFNDLPYRLKHCFLYCCVFPEDNLIRRKRLIRLWMAEGFVEEVRGLTPEQVAESYLVELTCRSMLQVVERNPSGRPKTCKMHDLMRELALSISEREKFCVVHDGREAKGDGGARRLSIQTNDENRKPCTSMSQLRSFFVFVTGKVSPPSLSSMPSGFRLLRVLDMEYVPVNKLPLELGNLFNLRYLNLKGTLVEELPKSIGRLCNLQTLNLYQTKIRALPSEILKLQNLRYLIACHYNLELVDDFNYVNGTRVPSKISKLKNLQVLHFVDVEGDILRQVKNLTQLTCFGITKVKEVDEMDLCMSIPKLSLLRHLSVKVTNEEEVLQMNALSSPPPHLRRLNLIGKLEMVPHWFHSLQSLTALYLSWSRLREDPLPYIHALPNLRRLTLINAYAGEELCFRSGFCKLKNLTLRNFSQLNEIIIEKGVMTCIQDLWISKCMELKMLPQGIEHLTNLQNLNLASVSQDPIERIRGERSVDRQKVHHIPNINHYYQASTGWTYESLS